MNVILGGGYAGLLCALKLRAAGEAVLLVNGSAEFVERTRLHQWAAGQDLPRWSLRKVLGADFLEGWVTAFQPELRKVEVATPEGNRSLDYEQLVLALGSHTDIQQLPGASEYCYSLDAASAARLAQVLPASRRVLVIGAGLTGLELASELAEQHGQLEVTVVDGRPVGHDLSRPAARYLQGVLDRLGVRRRVAQVVRVEPGRAILAEGSLEFDIAVYCGGFRACPLAQEAGLAVNERGQLLVDEYLRSLSHPNIWGVGDAASPPWAQRMACATALPMGELAARNLLALRRGRPLRPLRQHFVARCLSLGRSRGLLQFTRPDDSVVPFYLWGGLGAWVKERILGGIALGSLKRAAR